MVGSSIAAFGLSTVIWPSLLMLQSVAMSGFVGALCGGVCLSIIFWILKGPVKLGVVAGAVGGFPYDCFSYGRWCSRSKRPSGDFIFIVISPTIGFLGGFFSISWSLISSDFPGKVQEIKFSSPSGRRRWNSGDRTWGQRWPACSGYYRRPFYCRRSG